MRLKTALGIFASTAFAYYFVGLIAQALIKSSPFPLSDLLLIVLPSPSDAAIDFSFTVLKCLIVGGIPTGIYLTH